MLQSVGMTGRQLKQMLVYEGLLLLARSRTALAGDCSAHGTACRFHGRKSLLVL